METFNYSGFGFGEFLNSSNINSEPTSVEESFKWTNAEIARLIQIIFRPILIIVGTIGNGLTIYIMRTTSLTHLSTCFYMVVLALADTSKYTLQFFFSKSLHSSKYYDSVRASRVHIYKFIGGVI